MTKSRNVTSLPDHEQIEEEAFLWALRLEEGELENNQELEFRAWIVRSDIHRQAFEEAVKFSKASDSLARLYDYANSDAAKQAMQREHHDKPKHLLWAGSIAAVVCLVIVLSVFNIDLFDQDIKFEGYYHTAVGSQEALDLPDGTVVRLNTNSRINIKFDRAQRSLYLMQGEAFFDVAPDAGRPFVVETPNGIARAIGTAFSVRFLDNKMKILVEEGVVAVEKKLLTSLDNGVERDEVKAVELTMGQTTTVGQDIEQIDDLDTPALEKTLDWRDGEITFNGETLEEVLRVIDRYTDQRIRIDDEELRNKRVFAYYKIGDVDRLLQALKIMANVEIDRISETEVRLYKVDK